MSQIDAADLDDLAGDAYLEEDSEEDEQLEEDTHQASLENEEGDE